MRPSWGPLTYLTSHFPALWRRIQRIKPLERLINRSAINSAIAQIEPRPNPLSTMAPYTSWTSLTDRTFSGRHLPPVRPGARRPATPAIDDVAALFVRDDAEMIGCPKSTVLFSYFAQWFTDGFLRTERNGPLGQLRNTRKNESNHEIDLAQLYGPKRAMTEQLRADDGLLKSQSIAGEEYPQFYCCDGKAKPEFDALIPPSGFEGLSPEQRNALFAMGTDTRNLGFMSFNVLFLREHNRIARQLGRQYSGWDSDRVFETTRSILTVLLLKIVVEEYINHISSSQFQLRLVPDSFPNEPWYRPNWMAIEFNLLYRWHSLVPSTFQLNGRPLKVGETLSNTELLTSTGLGQLMAAASDQPAGRIGLFNTDRFLAGMVEKASIEQARVAQLGSYNDYRRLCRLPPVATFDEVSSDPRIRDGLSALYDNAEDIEFYVGLFAEDAGPNEVLPPLMSTMVAFDAFSQALTNPLVAPRIFNEQTFSAVGMEIIESTKRISDLVHRNVPERPQPYFVSLTQRDYKPA